MSMDDLEPKKRTGAAETLAKEDLSMLGVAELAARIGLLEDEIARCRTMIEAKQGTRSAAEAIFKR